MAIDFSKLKKASTQSDATEKLAKATAAISSPTNTNSADENLWKPEVDKAGNGTATIRFLPPVAEDGDEALPWVQLWNHGFKGTNGLWLIENCPTTKGKGTPCPVCEHNTLLWNSGIEANKKLASNQKRKLNYFSNIYVVSDPKHPENNGKVKMFRYGKKIMDKISEAMNPAFEDEAKKFPFDLWKGSNFKLKIRKVDDYTNYDKSEFDAPTALLDDDDALEKVWKSAFALKSKVAEDQFHSYEDIKKRLDLVLGLTTSDKPKTTVDKLKEESKKLAPLDESFSEDENDSNMDYFAKLAEED